MVKKSIVIGIPGGIEVYQVASLVRALGKRYDVHVMMNRGAMKYVSSLTFKLLSSNPVITKVDEELLANTDAFILLPASERYIKRIARNMCVDVVTTSFLRCTKPKVLVPVVKEDLKEIITNIEKTNVYVVWDGNCKEDMAKVEDIECVLEYALHLDKPLANKHVLISGGTSLEKIDPTSYLTTSDTGMGIALAKAAKALGASVALVYGPTTSSIPYGVVGVYVKSVEDMAKYMGIFSASADVIIHGANASKYIPVSVFEETQRDVTLSLEHSDDLLLSLGMDKTNEQLLCGFTLENEDSKLLLYKNCDLVIGRKSDHVTLLSHGEELVLPQMSVERIAYTVFYKLISLERR